MFGGKPVTGFPRLAALGFLGGFLGAVVALFGNYLPLTARERTIPAAYLTPKFPGGMALRMAMVHDVLHERYLRHGAAWYEKRNVDMRTVIAAEKAKGGEPSAALFSAMDDLAVGLIVLHQEAEAVEVMNEKLLLLGVKEPEATPVKEVAATQGVMDRSDARAEYLRLLALPPLSEREQQQYSAEANLGTALIHGSMTAAMAGDKAARERLQSGLWHIERSVAINPLAHFGRETWQALAVRHFLASAEHPELLTTYTMVGDLILDERSPVRLPGYSRYGMLMVGSEDPAMPALTRVRIREGIRTAGISEGWGELVEPGHLQPMPFDEPVLALIGMWTLGGGPNPHSALALARIMESQNQREIAWEGYERALEMQAGFSVNQEVRETLVAACRERQEIIAKLERPADPKGWEAEMRARHVKELAWGQAYQRAYQDYEAQQIQAGVPLEAKDFYVKFFKDREEIASDPGQADEYVVAYIKPRSVTDFIPLAVLGAGCLMLLGYATRPRRRDKNPMAASVL